MACMICFETAVQLPGHLDIDHQQIVKTLIFAICDMSCEWIASQFGNTPKTTILHFKQQ